MAGARPDAASASAPATSPTFIFTSTAQSSYGGGGARALGELPVGWETAVAHEVTRMAKEKAVDVCDGLDAFAKHPLVKGSANEVLPHYVVGLYNLQTMGYVAASKRTRGALSKMTFDGA